MFGLSLGLLLLVNSNPPASLRWIHFFLATARDRVILASNGFVPTCAAIELVPLRIFRPLVPTVKVIVAIPAIEDILILECEDHVVAIAPVDDVIARTSE
jgi:hypothetical protein